MASPVTTPGKRTLNEAAHKLGHWPAEPEAPKERAQSAAMQAATNDERDVVAHAGRAVLALGALGIVYGDIGTSPLYTEQFIFTAHRNAAHATVAGVYGIASLIFWTLMVEVSLKYGGFIMRAHNRGDGGIMALAALLQRHRVATGAVLLTLGIFGAGLFFGERHHHPDDRPHLHRAKRRGGAPVPGRSRPRRWVRGRRARRLLVAPVRYR